MTSSTLIVDLTVGDFDAIWAVSELMVLLVAITLGIVAGYLLSRAGT